AEAPEDERVVRQRRSPEHARVRAAFAPLRVVEVRAVGGVEDRVHLLISLRAVARRRHASPLFPTESSAGSRSGAGSSPPFTLRGHHRPPRSPSRVACPSPGGGRGARPSKPPSPRASS